MARQNGFRLSPDLIQHERSQLDAKIEELELALIELKKRRNSLSPVSVLHPDVLLYVFEHLQGQGSLSNASCPYSLFTTPPSTSPSTFTDLRAMTHVCSLWRGIALSSPGLWADITLGSDPQARITEVLRRSRGVPLSISVTQNEDGQDDTNLRILAQELHRTRSLHIHAYIPTFFQYLHTPIKVTNVLEVLCLSVSSHCPIQLRGIVQLLKMSSQTLRSLHLGGLPAFFAETITFPRLSQLSIIQFPELVTKFVIPATCIVSLQCHRYRSTPELQNELLPTLQQICRMKFSAGRPLKHLQFSRKLPADDLPSILISFSSGLQTSPDLFLTLKEDFPSESSTSTIKEVLSSFILSEVTIITFLREIYLHSTTWAFLAEKCYNLHSIVVHRFEEFWPLCDALSVYAPTPNHDQAVYDPNEPATLLYPFPNLNKLEFHHLALDGGSCTYLYGALDSRLLSGFPLSELVLNDVEIEDDETEFLHSLQSYVQGSITYVPAYNVSDGEGGDEEST